MNTTTTTQAAAIFRRHGEGDHITQMHACVSVKLAAGDAEDGRVSAAEFWMPAQFGPPLHVHHREDELLQILEGTVRVVCGSDDRTLEAGAFAYLPRGVPHTFKVTGDEPARMLAIFTPGGLERLFVQSGVPTERAALPDGDQMPPVALETLTARFGVEHIGPPLP
jgi:mannose-6-phosphate isomerase-like protein (cupin superfamily)